MSLKSGGLACRAQVIAITGSAAILPDDRVVDRLSRSPIPDDRRLALVGDPDGGDVAGLETQVRQGFRSHPLLCRPDLCCVVFDPAGTREYLPKFALCGGQNGSGMVEDDGARTGRSLVEGEHVGHGVLSALRRRWIHGGVRQYTPREGEMIDECVLVKRDTKATPSRHQTSSVQSAASG